MIKINAIKKFRWDNKNRSAIEWTSPLKYSLSVSSRLSLYLSPKASLVSVVKASLFFSIALLSQTSTTYKVNNKSKHAGGGGTKCGGFRLLFHS